jgi:hypothetical protein
MTPTALQIENEFDQKKTQKTHRNIRKRMRCEAQYKINNPLHKQCSITNAMHVHQTCATPTQNLVACISNT